MWDAQVQTISDNLTFNCYELQESIEQPGRFLA
ncbi:MAG: hypothetical protein K0R38_6116, partial [Polyangiaceae bacterium]|nr:hypothetical protein [Polyangiaceae bacterium]